MLEIEKVYFSWNKLISYFQKVFRLDGLYVGLIVLLLHSWLNFVIS